MRRTDAISANREYNARRAKAIRKVKAEIARRRERQQALAARTTDRDLLEDAAYQAFLRDEYAEDDRPDRYADISAADDVRYEYYGSR